MKQKEDFSSLSNGVTKVKAFGSTNKNDRVKHYVFQYYAPCLHHLLERNISLISPGLFSHFLLFMVFHSFTPGFNYIWENYHIQIKTCVSRT